jgi:hypothetical protein
MRGLDVVARRAPFRTMGCSCCVGPCLGGEFLRDAVGFVASMWRKWGYAEVKDLQVSYSRGLSFVLQILDHDTSYIIKVPRKYWESENCRKNLVDGERCWSVLTAQL